jgi:GNAT superfamily N-acetyltransferase
MTDVSGLPGHFHLSPCSAKDVEELSRLVNSAYRGESSRAGWTTEADFLDGQRTDPDSLLKLLDSPGDRTILCWRKMPGGPILGCVLLERFQDKRGVGCYLGMLTVEPTLQAQGIGRRLIKSAEDFARSWGAKRMTLGVIHLRDTLIAWYERQGYTKTGETKPFPYGNEKAGIPRRADLHFMLFEKQLF